MADYRSGRVRCAHGGGEHSMAYRDWGPEESRDLVICVHGLARNGADFDELAAALAAKGRRVICPDVVGRGASERLADPSGYAVPQYLLDMAVLIQALQPKRIDWIGTSMGGLMGMVLAAQGELPIKRLILNDIGPFVPQAALAFIADYVGDCPLFSDLRQAEDFLRNRCQSFGPLGDAAWRKVTQDSTHAVPGGYRLHYDPAIAIPFREAAKADIDLWPIWEQVACPVLTIRGAQSIVLPKETAKRMTLKRPHSDLVEIEGCGHAPWLKTYEQLSIILDWLA